MDAESTNLHKSRISRSTEQWRWLVSSTGFGQYVDISHTRALAISIDLGTLTSDEVSES